MKRREFLQLSLATAASAALSRGAQAQADSKEIRIGYQKNGVLVITRQRESLENHFKPQGVSVKWVEFSSGPPMMEAMNVGSVDYGAVGDSPPIFAQAAGAAIVYAAAQPIINGSGILVPQNSAIKTIADLKGKRVGFTKGSSAHNVVIQTLEKAGLTYNDITPVYLTPPDAGPAFANGGIDDVTVARRQLGKGPALWFRQGDKRYVVRDPMLIQTLQRAYSGAADLGRQQSELGRQQSALGREQGELGRQMGEMGRLQGEESRRLALAAAEVARSAMAAHDINREAAAEAAKAARGATSDMAVAREAAREAAAEARRAMQEARSEAAQSGRTRDMQRLASQQSELASRQAALGSQQAALGERQARVHAQASQQAQQVIARALASGKAERL